MDRFTVMRSFVAVVRVGSFASAARSMGISRALVSRHISELERQVKTRLLNRTTRSVSLTEPGTRYYEFSNRILSDIDAEDSAISGLRDLPEGALAVVSPKWIGSLDLGDAIASFAAEYPRIKVRLDVGRISERTHDFIDDKYDIAFHTKYLRDSTVMVRKIATLKFVLCASPAYLGRYGEPAEPKDLAAHDCLVHVTDPVWHFSGGGKKQYLKPQQIAFSSNTYLVLQKAALRGMGIALVPLRSTYQDIVAGNLRVVLGDYAVPDRPLYAVYPPGQQNVRKVRCFIDFIASWFNEHPLPSGKPAVTAEVVPLPAVTRRQAGTERRKSIRAA